MYHFNDVKDSRNQWASEKDFVHCNLCGSDRYTVIAETRRHVPTAEETYTFQIRLVCCNRCGLVYCNPHKEKRELQRYYANAYRSPVAFNNIDERRRKIIQSRIQLLNQYVAAPRGSLLEIGSGEGFFLQRALAKGLQVVGIEPSNSYAETSRSLIPQLHVEETYFEDYETEDRFDVICSFFVLEHTLDPTTFLKKCHHLLLKDGCLYIEVPDIALYPRQFSDMVSHEHTYHFSALTIKKMLAKTGFRVSDIRSPGSSYEFGMAVIAQKNEVKEIDQTSWHSMDPTAYNQSVLCFQKHFKTLEKYRAALKSEMESLLNRIRAGQCKMAIYGTGIFYDLLFTHTNLGTGDAILVIDDNEKKWYKPTTQGLKIEPPSRLAEIGVDVILIASDCFEAKMTENVRQWSCAHRRQYEPFCLHTRAAKLSLELGGV